MYAVIKDNIIVQVLISSDGINGVKQSLKNQKIDYDTIKEYSDSLQGGEGTDIRHLDSLGKYRPENDLILEGLIPCPICYKIENGTIVEKTTKELLDCGVLVLKETETYDESIGLIRDKTEAELYTAEELELREREILIQNEMRKIAEERLIAAGTITG